MGLARKERRRKLRGDKDMHHATAKHDHYHAVVDTQWRGVGNDVFAEPGRCIKTAVRAFEVVRHPVAQSSQLMQNEAKEKSRIMQRILLNDAEIRHLAEPWLEDLDQMMGGKPALLH